jgi:hypothetical protein
MSKEKQTAIHDPDYSEGTVYVDLTMQEVLEACERYKSDKQFNQALMTVYNPKTDNSWVYWSLGDET